MLRFLVPRVTEDVQLQCVINERAAERPLRTGKFSFITVAPTSPFSHRYPLALLAGQPEGQVCGGVLEPQQELHWAEIAVWFKMSTFVDSQGLVQKVQSGGQITNPGRPRLLTDAAEARVLEFVAQARKDGAVIDRETLALLGKEV